MSKRIYKVIKLIVFLTVFALASSKVISVSAVEAVPGEVQSGETGAMIEVGEDSSAVQQIEQIGNIAKEGGEKASELTLSALRQMIRIVPYVGVILFLVGVFLAVFSTRNKGNRRFGIKMAVTEAIIVYVVYIGLILMYDFAYNKGVIQFASQPINAERYEKVYFDVLQSLKNDGESFLFLGADWISGLAVAGRRMYVSVVELLMYVSVSAGILVFFVTKRDKPIRRFAIAGMCIVIPVALFVGYRFLKI